MNKDNSSKEFALYDFMEMTKRSWTWGRMTEDEHKRYLEAVALGFELGQIKGSYKDRWETLQLTYSMFLAAIKYEPSGWRDKENKKNENGND